MHFVHESESQMFDSIALILNIFRGEREFPFPSIPRNESL